MELDQIIEAITQVEINPPAVDSVDIQVMGETVVNASLPSVVFYGTPLPDIIDARDDALTQIETAETSALTDIDTARTTAINQINPLVTSASQSASTASTHASTALTYRNQAETFKLQSDNINQSVTAQSGLIFDAQAQTNALLGLGIGSSFIDENGDLIMSYNDATVTSLAFNANGELIITY
jgi:hypothetical protein